jgi:hypothetical protein
MVTAAVQCARRGAAPTRQLGVRAVSQVIQQKTEGLQERMKITDVPSALQAPKAEP